MTFNSITAAREAARLSAWKDPVVIAVAGSTTRSGLQLLQGVQLVANQRVLIVDGINAGVWITSSNAWGRSDDTRAVGSLRTGTRLAVEAGDSAGVVFKLSTSNPIVIGTTSQAWEEDTSGGGGFNNQAATVNVATTGAAGTTNVGTRAGETVNVGSATSAVNVATAALTIAGAGAFTQTCTSWGLASSVGITATTTSGAPLQLVSGAALNATATTNARVGVSATTGSVWLGSSGDGLHTTPQLVQIGSLPGSGTHAVNLHGRVTTVQGSLSLALAAPTLTLNSVRVGDRYARCATTTNDSLSGLAARDGVTPVAGDNVLVMHHATGASEGLYIAAAGAWSRHPAWAVGQTIDSGKLVHVATGTANGGKTFKLTNVAGAIVGTDTPTFSQFGAGGGGGTSISNGGATLAIDGSGNLTTSGTIPVVQLSALGAGAYFNVFSDEAAGLTGGGGDTNLLLSSAAKPTWIQLQGAVTSWASPVTQWAGNGGDGDVVGVSGIWGWVWDANSGAVRGRYYEPTSGALAMTEVLDAAACSRVTVGPWTINTGCVISTSGEVTSTQFSTANGRITSSGGTYYGAYTDAAPMILSAFGSATCESRNGDLLCKGGAYLKLEAGGSISADCGAGFELFELLRGGAARVRIRFPTAVTPPSSAATALGTITVPASTAGRFEGHLSIRNGSSNSKQFAVVLSWNADGTTVAKRDDAATVAGTTQGTIATANSDVSFSQAGLVITVLVANASGFRCALSGLSHINQ